ncbi:GntR family transcriptional regulator [Bradyrhizobium sp. BR 10289]|uniref:GntR family transcriptional regulator n=1 Tax=Bradyrhizobium sp. BR 10289 TaxID=2749993 RepID=UPI001C648B56|nr:GntR family transcriptional regulator [Bradyrhizobium sp. BR 10289]MBW7969631.1 GntR family transcriptional regulator [Bradyrhizobium sp. BR 10289]
MARSTQQTRFRLANQILDVIRDAKLGPGHHLREQQLADLIGVSRTPIRSALDLLAERGIVETRKNHGFFLRRPFDTLHHIEIEVPSTAEEKLYARLVRDRLEHRIPNSITQSEIARRYDVDRIALARTLSRLAEDGLIARKQGHGWTFLPTLDSLVSLRASYEFRLTIEPSAFLLATFKPDPAAIERMRLQHLYLASHPDISSVSSTQLFETDAAFHEMCAEFCGNAFFAQAVQYQNRLRRLLEYGSYFDGRRVREWCREHLAIIESIAAGNLIEASTRMRAHLEQAFASAQAAAR